MLHRAVALSGSLLVAGLCGCASSTAHPAAVKPASITSGCRQSGPGFALSLASSTGGEATPERAAVTFVRRGSVWDAPQNGWRVTERGSQGATVQAGTFQLHAVQGPDGRWQVDSGRCL